MPRWLQAGGSAAQIGGYPAILGVDIFQASIDTARDGGLDTAADVETVEVAMFVLVGEDQFIVLIVDRYATVRIATLAVQQKRLAEDGADARARRDIATRTHAQAVFAVQFAAGLGCRAVDAGIGADHQIAVRADVVADFAAIGHAALARAPADAVDAIGQRYANVRVIPAGPQFDPGTVERWYDVLSKGRCRNTSHHGGSCERNDLHEFLPQPARSPARHQRAEFR